MSKYLWLTMGAMLAVGGIALMLFDNPGAGIALLVASTFPDLRFVEQVHDERRAQSVPR